MLRYVPLSQCPYSTGQVEVEALYLSVLCMWTLLVWIGWSMWSVDRFSSNRSFHWIPSTPPYGCEHFVREYNLVYYDFFTSVFQLCILIGS